MKSARATEASRAPEASTREAEAGANIPVGRVALAVAIADLNILY